MKNVLFSASVILIAAGSAMAQLSPAGPSNTERTPNQNTLGDALRGTPSGLVSFNVAGIQSWDAFGDTSNQLASLDIAAALGLPSGTPIDITGIGWDVTVTAIGTSWQSELAVSFGPLQLTPGAGTNTPGTGTFSSGGIIDLSDIAFPNISLPTGVLSMEFFEGFDDIADSVDGTWDAGSLSFAVTPAPGAFALLGLGGLAAARRRRN